MEFEVIHAIHKSTNVIFYIDTESMEIRERALSISFEILAQTKSEIAFTIQQ